MKVKEFIQSVRKELSEIISEGEIDAHIRILSEHFLNLNKRIIEE